MGFLILSRSVSGHSAKISSPQPPRTFGQWVTVPAGITPVGCIACRPDSLSYQASIYSSSPLCPGVTLDRLLGALLCVSPNPGLRIFSLLPFILTAGHALVSSIPSVSPTDPPLPFSPSHFFDCTWGGGERRNRPWKAGINITRRMLCEPQHHSLWAGSPQTSSWGTKPTGIDPSTPSPKVSFSSAKS